MNDISDIFSIIPSVDIALDKLLNGTDPNAIIVDVSLKNEIITLLNNVKSKSNNIDFQFILNDIIAEINTISGKTKNEIINEL
ncbi:MAG: hypothetical protein PSN34_00520 [Urechidicola sp.]|nr:hypothetical protein [Urechidicola sp.]